jgi:capsular exopolysaccharide synthesis family protein
MQIADILGALWRRRWVVLVVLVVCLGASALLTALTPPVYLTTAVMRVLTPGTGLADTGTWINTQYSDRLSATYLEVLASQPVQQELAARLGTTLDTLPDVVVEAVPGTELMAVRVFDRDPAIANTFAQMLQENPYWLYGDRRSAFEALRQKLAASEAALADLRQRYEAIFEEANPNRNSVDALRSQLSLEEENYRSLTAQFQTASLAQEVQQASVSLVSAAEAPKEPYRPVVLVNILIGLVAGLAGGVILALVLDNLDDTLYTTTQIEQTAGNSIIGMIPRGRSAETATLRVDERDVFEGVRWLRASILAESAGLHTVLVTSASDREGKSTVVGNLAVAAAQTHRKVLLIDGNLRKPALHVMFGVPNESGLGDVLTGSAAPEQAVRRVDDDSLFLLTAGQRGDVAADLLSSDRVPALLTALANDYDLILIDSPAANIYADAIALSPLVDGVVVVAESGRTTAAELTSLMNSLAVVKGSVAGLVVNRAAGKARKGLAAARSRSKDIATTPASASAH